LGVVGVEVRARLLQDWPRPDVDRLRGVREGPAATPVLEERAAFDPLLDRSRRQPADARSVRPDFLIEALRQAGLAEAVLEQGAQLAEVERHHLEAQAGAAAHELAEPIVR